MRSPYYSDPLVTLYHGDARDVLAEIELQVDCLLTDPPYGQQFAGDGAATKKANIRGDGARQGIRVARQAFFEVDRHLAADAHCLSFCHWESWPDFYDGVSSLWPIKSAIIWWKDRGGMGDTAMEYARDYEVVLYAAKGRRPIAGRRDGAVIEGFPPVGAGRLHPTEKPLELMRYLLERHCPPGGLALDPFAGSGTTLLAAAELGIRSVWIEIEERYCETTAKRLASRTPSMFGELHA